MAKNVHNLKDADAGERLKFFEFASKMWQDGDQLRRIREALGLSKAELARRAKITPSKLSLYERPGKIRGNFWIFCHDLRSFYVDPRLIDDAGYLDGLLDPDPNDHLKGGSEMDRDEWFEFDGPKYRKFRRWAHRNRIEKLPDAERKKPRTRKQISEWHDEWVKAKCPDANDIIEANDSEE